MRENIKKLFTLFLCLAMAIGLLPMAALADEVPASTDGVVGSNNAYESGEWATTGGTSVTDNGTMLTKTAVKADAADTFDITLKVETETNTSTVSAPAAVTLVIDTSNSMGYCAKCGRDDLYTSPFSGKTR